MTICEFGTKLGHRLTYNSHGSDLGGVHHFLLYSIACDCLQNLH
jgi:hypothetical protein